MIVLRKLWSKIYGAPRRERSPSIQPPIQHVTSPVPWIDDRIWSRWMWDRRLTDLHHDGEWETLPEFRLFVATPADRARAPVAPVPEGAPVPPVGTYAQHAALLRGTPPAPGILCASWPICCDHLATLIHEQGAGAGVNDLEGHTGPLDHAFIEEDLIEGETDPRIIRNDLSAGYRDTLATARRLGTADGLLLHQCRTCGRVYVGACHT